MLRPLHKQPPFRATFPSPASTATSSTGSTDASENFPRAPRQSTVLRNHLVSSGYSSYPLAERSLEPVARDESGRIISGLWRDAHTGFESRNPSDFDIDHRVPFKEIVDQFPQMYELSNAEQFAIYNDPDIRKVDQEIEERSAARSSCAPCRA